MQTNRSTTDLPASPSLEGYKTPTTRHNENAEALALRGLAIIGIFLHNYCHWLNPVVKENEYTYSQHRVDAFNHAVLHADALLPMHLLSFFGHYGVPIFLFLSAYGLVKKYETSAPISSSNTNDTGFLHFASIHFLKLFRMMIVGFTAFVLVDAVTPGAWHYDVLKITAQHSARPRPSNLARPLLVLWIDAAILSALSTVALSPPLGSYGGADAAVRGHTTAANARRRCHEQIPI